MLRVGLEPTRSFDQKILNLPSLPISSSEQLIDNGLLMNLFVNLQMYILIGEVGLEPTTVRV